MVHAWAKRHDPIGIDFELTVITGLDLQKIKRVSNAGPLI